MRLVLIHGLEKLLLYAESHNPSLKQFANVMGHVFIALIPAVQNLGPLATIAFPQNFVIHRPLSHLFNSLYVGTSRDKQTNAL